MVAIITTCSAGLTRSEVVISVVVTKTFSIAVVGVDKSTVLSNTRARGGNFGNGGAVFGVVVTDIERHTKDEA